MTKTLHRLTAQQIKNAAPGKSLSDGGGLSLRVTAGGHKRWVFRFKMKGQSQREMGQGSYPGTTLAHARLKVAAARDLIAAGVDPIADAERRTVERASQITFADYVDTFLPWKTQNFSNPKHIAQWGMSLRKYAAPLAAKPLADITRQDILELLKPMWETKHVSASRLRGRLENLFDHAIQNGAYQRDNPARWSLFNATLSAPRKLTGGHRPALPRKDMPAFIQALRSKESMGAFALEFLVLTAARSGEVRLAHWSEFDLEAKLWNIPAGRMKMRRPHVVPLSERALDILEQTKRLRLTDPTADSYVFEGAKENRPMSDMTIRAVMRRMELGEYVPHGFRSTFRDWAGSETHFPRELAEEALAHALGGTERAYRREQAVVKRREMMDVWAAFLGGEKYGR
ncbi:tyrosine-type recombinase/integrase [Aliiroseovarius lamellibrachiae]|uniref:tyrosine-type recombinase/integrase n=1 Tax=Aliiroseovarius lamellibrachiae TaxID=1924933 RepID=UPI001BE0FC1C|nr:site-specific integrase [Aliiroseovarius lamellibrachiae]MBT2132500.1 integrase arm-type DNA-binding domain-containing protein [Aliiroseovarius lamellibrachiae]